MMIFLLLAASLFGEMQWRAIGPFRGGRTKAASGVPQRPGTFYIGAVNGGVWRSDDYGRTWQPIFDEQDTGSIGALAVAPSNPDVIYVGSGEGLQRPDLSVGDGMYKSNDAGKTWRHLSGLRDGQQLPQIAVDPRDPQRLFVAVLGHPYGPNDERGLYRSTDGGETFTKILGEGPDVGASDVVIDPQNPQTVYAALWEARQAPWENGEFNGPGSGLYKSADGGTTWRKLGKGLPDWEHDKVGRFGIGIAPSMPSRVFATVQVGKEEGRLYRSDDAGESWVKITDDTRPADRPDDFAEVKVDPKNPEIVYTASVVSWRSEDGGKTWRAFRGAPGGDDYHRLWIDPSNTNVVLLAGDQGGMVTVDGGATWSSWFNQPTSAMFHVTADNAFPYRLCGGQQDSGSACVSSRGPDGRITFRDWHPVGVEEYGSAAPDPRDPDIVFGGKVSRWDRRTGDVQELAPVASRSPSYRVIRTQPILFSPTDPRTLYFASNTVWKTQDQGRSWMQISPDLTRKTWEDPPNVGKYKDTDEAKPGQRGVVYALAPSPKDARTIWAGSDDGLLHVTRDGGKSWRDVTPAQLVPWAKVSILEASHFDAREAYAAIDTMRLDDWRPHLLRTRDGGKTWSEIVKGLPGRGTITRVIREDPKRRGLLFCGTEEQVYVSFDDGDSWQSLRLNMPASSVRDLIVKDNDLAVATHGRGFYILDDIEPLREIGGAGFAGDGRSPKGAASIDAIATEDAHLFTPAPALRIRNDTNTDTPMPPDEPAGPNPPDGAIIDYLLKAPAGEVTLEILDARGKLVRKFSSTDKTEPPGDEGNVPRWWIRPPRAPSAAAGLHRFVWDLHWPPVPTLDPQYPIAATPHDTPREPRGPWVMPGRYTVKLTAGGKSLTQPLVVKMDPRIKTPLPALQKQFDASQRLAAAIRDDLDALGQLRELRKSHPANDAGLAALEGSMEERRPWAKESPPALAPWSARLTGAYEVLQGSDAAPTDRALKAADRLVKEANELVARFRKVAAKHE